MQIISQDLTCRSEEAAALALAVIRFRSWTGGRLAVERRFSHPQHHYLSITAYDGRFWPEGEARELWSALAPYMADGATLAFANLTRIRWNDGRTYRESHVKGRWKTLEELT